MNRVVSWNYNHQTSEGARRRGGRGVTRIQRKNCTHTNTYKNTLYKLWPLIRGYFQNILNLHRGSWGNIYPSLAQLLPFIALVVPLFGPQPLENKAKEPFDLVNICQCSGIKVKVDNGKYHAHHTPLHHNIHYCPLPRWKVV